MQVGVSTACLYPMESEQSLKLLLKQKSQYFEFFINAYIETQKPFLSEIKMILDDNGARINSIHPYTSFAESMMFFGNYERRIAEGLEFYKIFFNAASFLGAEIFVLHGQSLGRNGKFTLSDDEYCERYSKIYELGKSFGVTVCQENVFAHRSGSIELIKTMRNKLKSEVAFVFDIKQCQLCGENPVKMIAAMGDKLMHVHLSDSDSTHTCLLPGSGIIDYDEIREALKAIEYNRSVIIEVYSSNYKNVSEIGKSLVFTKKKLIY